MPDENFEQVLIDLGIDTDGVINGQVLTADIENVIELNFSNLDTGYKIEEFNGIENFTQLEILNLTDRVGISFYGDEAKTDFVNDNVNLREIYMSNGSADVPNISIENLNFSNLENLKYVDLSNVDIKSIGIGV